MLEQFVSHCRAQSDVTFAGMGDVARQL
jgi:hypothetical protein